MKRYGNLYEQVCSMDNILLADKKARRGKSWQYGVKVFDRARENNLHELQRLLKTKTYHTPAYDVFIIHDPKEREIYRLPYRDRIVHHAIMNILESIFVSTFTTDTYSCIKKRGIHAAARNLKKALGDEQNTQYCLQNVGY